LQHTPSGKYVHPHSGTSTPGDNEPLVVWDGHGDGGDKCKFYFAKDDQGHRQLRHYASSKYVYLHEGKVDNGKSLVFWRSSGKAISSFTFIKRDDGNTYLTHGSLDLTVFPINQGNVIIGTQLVLCHICKPDARMNLVPAESYSIISMDFDETSFEQVNNGTIAVDTIVDNSTSSTPLRTTVSLDYNRSVTNTFEFIFPEELGIAVTGSFGASFKIFEASVSVTTSFKFGQSQTATESTTEGVAVSISVNVEVPPFKQEKVTLITRRLQGKIPYVATVKSVRDQIFELKGVMQMDYYFDQRLTIEDL